jgi:hypothetical protein
LKHALTIGSEVGQIKVYRAASERIESQSVLGRREKSALASALSLRDIDIVMERTLCADQREGRLRMEWAEREKRAAPRPSVAAHSKHLVLPARLHQRPHIYREREKAERNREN